MDPALTQTIVRDMPVQPGGGMDNLLAALEDPDRARDLLLLHQLSLKLLGIEDPDEVVRTALETVAEPHGRVRRGVSLVE